MNNNAINLYGVLITVLAFLFIVSYAEGEYDIFDLIIAFVTLKFSTLCIQKKVVADAFSMFLCLLILSSSLLIMILFTLGFFKDLGMTSLSGISINEIENGGIVFCFLISLILSYRVEDELN